MIIFLVLMLSSIIIFFSLFVFFSLLMDYLKFMEKRKIEKDFFDTFDPEKHISKRSLEMRKYDLKFLMEIIKSDGKQIYTAKADIEDLLVINGVLKCSQIRPGILKLNSDSGYTVEMIKKLTFLWYSYISKLENEMFEDSEIDDLLENEIKTVAKNNKKKFAVQKQIQAEG